MLHAWHVQSPVPHFGFVQSVLLLHQAQVQFERQKVYWQKLLLASQNSEQLSPGGIPAAPGVQLTLQGQ